jgi:hypothetical protein
MRDGRVQNPVPFAAEEGCKRVDEHPGSRIARLAWFELAAAATRRALAQEALAARLSGEAD